MSSTTTSGTDAPPTTVQKVIALDPGKTTGYAEWTESGGWSAAELTVTEVFDRIEQEDYEAQRGNYAVQLVSESFVITVNTAKNSQAGWSLELIGVFKYVQHHSGTRWPELKLQTPQVAKAFGTDDKLRMMGWWTKGKGGHANDASRHLLTYCATRSPWAEKVIGFDRLKQMAEL